MAFCSYNDFPATSFDRKIFDDLADMPSNIQTGIRLARNSSLKCTGRYRIGACIVHNNQYCIGRCDDRTHPLQKKFASKTPAKITLHAEIDVLSKIKDTTIDIDYMFVVRTTKGEKNYASSMPCDICLGAITAYNVKNLVFHVENKWHIVDMTS